MAFGCIPADHSDAMDVQARVFAVIVAVLAVGCIGGAALAWAVFA